MKRTTESTQISIPEDLVKEIEVVRGNVALESFVCQAIRGYVCALRQRKSLGKTTQECARSEDAYDELPLDLANEVWLCLERDARRNARRREHNRFSEN